MNEHEISHQEINGMIRHLSDIKGSHTELISLYIPSGRSRSDIVRYLKKEQAETKNIKSKATRKHVFGAITSLIGQVNQL